MTKFALALIVILGSIALAEACNVPVFRFALERWRPDPYVMTVFHRGALAASDRSLLDALEARQEKSGVNLLVRRVDVSGLDDADLTLFESLDQPTLPALAVQYPEHLQIAAPIWSSPLNADAITRLTDSSLRSELVRRLADGQTAVWLLLESGQSEKDEAAAKLLLARLKTLEQELKLPELTEASEDMLLAATPLKVAFSLLRVPRGEAEQPLMQMLLHSEPDLAERSDPIVFPVFGRGRALWPLVGAGITEDNIHDSAAFLVGACSCEVKDLNPGFDLLLAADWGSMLSQDGQPLIAIETRHSSPPGDAEFVPIPPGSPKTEESVTAPEPQPTSRRWVIAGLLTGGVALIVGLLLRR